MLCDKTGTLTQNKMLLKHFQVLEKTFSHDKAYVSPQPQPPQFMNIDLISKDSKAKVPIRSQEQMNRLFFIGVNTCHECFSEQQTKELMLDVSRMTDASNYKGKKSLASSQNLLTEQRALTTRS